LYCQNYQFRELTRSPGTTSADELARAVDDKTTCICYFGGDPSPHILHALKTSSIALRETEGRVLRICWETNGAMELPFLERIAGLSLRSGGCIKFDLKAWHDGVHRALCGVTNTRTLENFKEVSRLMSRRPEPPLLIASTLLVPGYVDEQEVSSIAEYLALLDHDIPYRLLGFYPHLSLRDLPTTSRTHAARCKQAAEQAGLRRVSVGNIHLLGDDYT
jgi:pyruvate formate lyase activating enzyme